MVQLSLVIPSFNEAARIETCLEDLFSSWAQAQFSWELIVVDDGSAQNHLLQTRETILKFQKKYSSISIRLLELSKNQGKGAALQHGFESSQAEFMGFLDADGATSAASALRAAQLMVSTKSGADAVIGSRIKMLGRSVSRKFSRHLVGRFFATLVSVSFGVEVYDSQCGCKFFKRSVIAPLMKLISDSRWTWDTQLLLLMCALKSKVIEVPVDWHEVEGSKIRILRDSWRMFKALNKFHAECYKNSDWIVSYQKEMIQNRQGKNDRMAA